MKPGDLLCNRFVLERPLGVPGAIGEAWAVHDQLTKLEFVCKVAKHVDTGTRDEFLAQHSVLHALRSDALAPTFGYFEHDDNGHARPVLLLEWVKGEPLADWLQTKRSLRERALVLERVASALGTLHGMKVLHGDVHARNVIVVPAELRAVLIDPGSDRFGSTIDGALGRKAPANEEQDLQELGALFERTLGAETRIFEEVVSRLRVGQGIDAMAAAARVRAAMAGNLLETGGGQRRDSYLAKKERNFAKYKEVRIGRALELDRLNRDLGDITKAWGCSYTGERLMTPDAIAGELRSDNEEVGSYAPRAYEVRAGAGSWDVNFRSLYFTKPWPETEGRAGTGQSVIASLFEEKLEIRYLDGAARAVAGAPDINFPCGRLWMERNLHLLTNEMIPLRKEGYLIEPSLKPNETGVGEKLRLALAAELETMRRTLGYQQRPHEGVITTQTTERAFLETYATNACACGGLRALYSVDVTRHDQPSPRFELHYLVLLGDGTPAAYRFTAEVLKRGKPIVTLLDD